MSQVLKDKLLERYTAAYAAYKHAMKLASSCIKDMQEARRFWVASFGDTDELDMIFKMEHRGLGFLSGNKILSTKPQR